ncbi:MAG TPA: hypothetical protein VNI78_01275 [Vicinamibacterales bacterium]|nr:hypothetical protein [Vicinamibacterales bacterium]
MVLSRVMSLALAAVLLIGPADVLAQGRGHARGRSDNGPAFCRSGQGHPVFGWQWCRERGWGDGRVRDVRRARDRRIDDRDVLRERVRNRRGVFTVAFDNGYADGYEKGLDDGRDGRTYDPTRHRWYRDGDRHYDSDYGSRAAYVNDYREGFRAGYEAGYADGDRYGRRASSFPWPF